MKRYLNSFNNKRDANEPEIIEALEAEGVAVYKLDKPADLLCSLSGRTFLVEVKSKNGKQTDQQVKFCKSWQGMYFIARTVVDAKAIIAMVQSD